MPTAQEHGSDIILIDDAINMLMRTDNSIAVKAYQLDFENPPYFSRLFKKEVSLRPVEYKDQFSN